MLLRAAAVEADKERFSGGLRNAMLLLESQGVAAWTLLHMLNERVGVGNAVHQAEIRYVLSAASAAMHLARLRRLRDDKHAFAMSVGRLFAMPLLFAELGEPFVRLVRFVRSRRCELSASIRQALGFSQYDFARELLATWNAGSVFEPAKGDEADYARVLADGLHISRAIHAPGAWEQTLRTVLGRSVASDRRSIRQFARRAARDVAIRMDVVEANSSLAGRPRARGGSGSLLQRFAVAR